MSSFPSSHDDAVLGALEVSLGYSFRDRDLLRQALTHSSRKNDLARSNERLEFLGDAVLGTVISERLYRAFPDFNEGDLTRIKSAVVSRVTLGRCARALDLGRYLIVAKGVARPVQSEPASATEEPSRRLPPSLLSNAFEAIIGAIYLDGGLEPVRQFVERHLGPEIERARTSHARDPKSLLQDYAQRLMGLTPAYELVSAQGPDHLKSFEVVTVIGDKRYGRGRGRTKKSAEQEAAAKTLAMLQSENPTSGPKAEA